MLTSLEIEACQKGRNPQMENHCPRTEYTKTSTVKKEKMFTQIWEWTGIEKHKIIEEIISASEETVPHSCQI